MFYHWEYVCYQLNPIQQFILKKSTKSFPNRLSCLHNALLSKPTHRLDHQVLLIINEGVNNTSTTPLSDFETRLATFKSWPPSIAIPPRTLAAAGFYYEGLADTVSCYSCGKSLKMWQPNDSPWFEHQRHSPLCAHLACPLIANYELQYNLIPRLDMTPPNRHTEDYDTTH